MNRKQANKNFLINNPQLRAPRMAHIRSIKPEFFEHEGVAELSPLARLAWIGLWTQSDKFGRFLWRLGTLKHKILPFDDIDFKALMNELLQHGFVQKYSVDGDDYGVNVNWDRHQGLGTHEKDSVFSYPAPPDNPQVPEQFTHSSRTVQEQFTHRPSPVGVGVGVGVDVGIGVEVGVGVQPSPQDGRQVSTDEPDRKENSNSAGKVKGSEITIEDLKSVWVEQGTKPAAMPTHGWPKLEDALRDAHLLARIDDVKRAFGSWLEDRYDRVVDTPGAAINFPLSIFADEVRVYLASEVLDEILASGTPGD